MTEEEKCRNHPDNPMTARCVRFDRRFCDLDFEPGAEPRAECLSAGTYCEFRSQCMVWAKIRRRRRKERELEEKSGAAAAGGAAR